MLLTALLLASAPLQRTPMCTPASARSTDVGARPGTDAHVRPGPGMTLQAGAGHTPRRTAWTTNEPYPLSSLLAGEEGTVEFRLKIDAGGCPVGCRITKSSGYDVLDRATCGVMYRKARFDPATDGEGRPVAGTYDSKFTWEIRE